MNIFGKDDASKKMQDAIEGSKRRRIAYRETHALKNAEIHAAGEANIAAIRRETDERLAEIGKQHQTDVQEMFNESAAKLAEQLTNKEITQTRYDRQIAGLKRIYKIVD